MRLCGYGITWLKEGLYGLVVTTYTNMMHLLFGSLKNKNFIVKLS